MLGKTQFTKNEDWLRTIETIEALVPKPALDRLADKTVWEIKKTLGDGRAAFCWSGGKDSVVLERLCYLAGVTKCLLVITNLEYPAFLRWVAGHKPRGLEIINTGQDLLWLKEHRRMLFPKDSRVASRWFQIVQHRGQNIFFDTNNLDFLILGRRKIDGNFVGKGNLYKTKTGVARYSPMADWPHEYILAFIHYYHLPLAPFYGWKNGFIYSTHPWPARRWTKTAWEDIYAIDKSIVRGAAAYLEPARQFLIKRGETP